VLTSQQHGGVATDSTAKTATVARTAPVRTVGFVVDPAATSATQFVAPGQPGDDLLVR
jgi:hypothetical protein